MNVNEISPVLDRRFFFSNSDKIRVKITKQTTINESIVQKQSEKITMIRDRIRITKPIKYAFVIFPRNENLIIIN
jgi:hypothetical protein